MDMCREFLKNIYNRVRNRPANCHSDFIAPNARVLMNQSLLTSSSLNSNISDTNFADSFCSTTVHKIVEAKSTITPVKIKEIIPKFLYFALIINSDEIKDIFNKNNIDLLELFHPDLTFKSEYHITLWFVGNADITNIKTYYDKIKDLIGTYQTILIKDFSYNSQFGRFSIILPDILSDFYISSENSIPHITLVHPDKDAKSAGIFTPTNKIEINLSLSVQLGVRVKFNKYMRTIFSPKDLNF
jgi:hypothetical protein